MCLQLAHCALQRGERVVLLSADAPGQLLPQALSLEIDLRPALRTGQLAPTTTFDVVRQLCDALEAAHAQGFVHRDLKPENVLLNNLGTVKLADFGLAKLRSLEAPMGTLTGELETMGTPHYMAPEQIEAPRSVDQRADLFSLGVLFYELLTGELPLGRFPLPSQKAPVDARLDEVVLRMLEKDPDRRYQKVADLRADLEAIARSARWSGFASTG